MGYHRIVVGTDGSATAAVAQRAAARIAKRAHAELTLVCSLAGAMTREMGETVLDYAKQAARKDGAAGAVGELSAELPADAILGTAERIGAELIVVGNKGMGHPSRFRAGSVPDRIAHGASCDVLIVDTTGATETGEGGRSTYDRILVGTDGSATASEAARKAMELGMMLRAQVTLCYVGDPLVGAITLEDTARGAPEGVNVDSVVAQGDPAKEICALAEREGIDLIVVGNKGMAGARRYLLEAVPNNVAHMAPTDVLIAKTVDRTLDEIAPGHGGVVKVEGQRVGVYKDPGGAVVAVSIRCTHMGCAVDWNDTERTWDCPCHGSRYDTEGKVIRGPATDPLTRYAVGR